MPNVSHNKSTSEFSETYFYGIALPIKYEADGVKPQDLVFSSRAEVLSTLKKFKEGRFNTFSSYDEALKYSSQWIVDKEVDKSCVESPDAEKSAFKGPPPKELATFRRFVEKGNIERVKDMIWSNPRYVISSGDTPVILMEGPRYNAFHCASKANQVQILKLLFETISDRGFMKMLYPNDDDDTTQNRISHITDLYLNTPDKAACDTPLHYASKFGAAECVEYLLACGCDTEKLNKMDEKASDIICSRKPDANIKTQIESMFQSRFYVPLIREDDDEICKIGKPCTAVPRNENVKALAGPMSPQQADELYSLLRSPRSINTETLNIRLTDSQKGIERIARTLCRKSDVKWVEYWPFLERAVNLESDEGLQLLENHLRKMSLDQSKAFSFTGHEDLCERLSSLALSADNTVLNGGNEDIPEVFVTAPTSPEILKPFFLLGSSVSSWDFQAALALAESPIDDSVYPFIRKWLKFVQDECQFYALSPLSSPTPSWVSPTERRRSTPLRNSLGALLQPRQVFP